MKINSQFISDLPNNKWDMAMVKAIASYTTACDICLVAKGIEKHQQIEILKDIGCDQGQGFYWSKPISAKAFEIEFLKESL